jgi:deazaflavin-dependent oxidoreductase (nitroreductase family)
VLFGEEHVRQYEETGGKVGHDWQNGVPTLILTTVGRKSGNKYKSPLIYQEDDGTYVVVASKGGAPADPDWYRNLVAKPDVEVQVGADKFTARAHTADDSERARLWPKMAKVWPDYDNYQRKTDRQIPVVVLEKA